MPRSEAAAPSPLVFLPRPRDVRHRRSSLIDVTLAPAQREAVEGSAGQALLMLGEAGHGKTTVALHRLAYLWRTEQRQLRAVVIVPTEGLVQLLQPLVRRLGADVDVVTYDRWAARQARRSFRRLPRESELTPPTVMRLKRDPALQVALAALAARDPALLDDDADAPRRLISRYVSRGDLQHLFGDRRFLEHVAAQSTLLRPRDVSSTLERTRVQSGLTTEKAWRGVLLDPEKLTTVDGLAIDQGTPTEHADTVDVEDYAVLFELDRLRAEQRGSQPTRPRQFDALVIDEAQEFAPLELRLLGRSLAPDAALVVAGDADQQTDPTTSFAGWDTVMHELGRPAFSTTTLALNYRCPPAVAALARAVREGRTPDSADLANDPHVVLQGFARESDLIAAVGRGLAKVRRYDPRAAVAVVCREPLTARRMAALLRSQVPARLVFDRTLLAARLGAGDHRRRSQRARVRLRRRARSDPRRVPWRCPVTARALRRPHPRTAPSHGALDGETKPAASLALCTTSMTHFARALHQRSPRTTSGRRWLFVPYDQLSDQLGPLAREPAREVGIVLVECPAKAALRPYHRQKLALVLANLRHFALEQADRGVAVRHVVAPDDYASALAPLAAELGPLRVMEPAERELRADLAPLVERGALTVIPHEGWFTDERDFAAAGLRGAPSWRMDRFYAAVRKRTGILMEGGRPRGGRMSHDADNRQPWRGSPPAPSPPTFAADAITREVGDLIEARYGDHPGDLDLNALPATAADAHTLWAWAERACLPCFGPYEDAMSTQSSGLFHTRISPLLNLHRLLARQVVERALALPLPLGSQEGFVRQILGWREFVRHVHRATDGFRQVPGQAPRPAADPSALGTARPLPPAYWGANPSGLACLDRVVADVWREGYSHHITRLMVLSNVALLLDVSPRELTDCFWAAYVDAYDWVVEPNVLGMGTYATGELMITKPYVAGAGYVHRMSDYCETCAFVPAKTCPLTPLYWAFLARHQDALATNARMVIPLSSLRKRPEARRAEDAATFKRVSDALGAGRHLSG